MRRISAFLVAVLLPILAWSTVPSETYQVSYAGNGVTTEFAVPFVFDSSEELQVASRASNGDVTILTTGFTVNGAGTSTGEVEFSTAPASGVTIIIGQKAAMTQETDYVPNDAFSAETHEQALDHLTHISHRLDEQLQRSLRVPFGDESAGGAMELPSVSARAGKYLYFDDTTGEPSVAASIGDTALTQDLVGTTIYPRTAAEIAAGVTPEAYYYPPGNILRQIAPSEHAAILAGTSTFDASTDAQEWLSALEPGAVACLVGTVRAQGLRLKTNNIDFECGGWLKPVSNAAPATILTFGDDSDDTQVRRARGHIRVGSESDSFASWTNITGINFERCTEFDLGIDAVGLGVGLLFAPGEGAVAYNQFRLGLIGQNKVGLRVAPTSTGFVNENSFFAPRFRINTGTYAAGAVSVDIQNGGSNQPNNLRFYSPTFEGPAQAISNNGSRIRFMDARWEGVYSGTPGTDYPAEIISLGSSEKEGVYDFSYNADVLSGGYAVDHGAGTRVDDQTFTIAGVDVTPWFYPGAMIKVTISATDYTVPVIASSFSTNTTVRVARSIITGSPTASITTRMTVDTPNDPRFVHFSDMDIATVSDMSYSAIVRQRTAFIASPITIRGLNSDYAGITMLPGGSAGDTAWETHDFSARTAYTTYQGRAWVSRLAVGSQTTPAATQSANADTSGATLGQLETEVNELKAVLRTFGLIAP